jgi:threonine synthase
MGLPVSGFIASTNVNNSVPRYLSTGNYQPSETIATISNAMDVGAPSNFARMNHLYKGSASEMKKDITGYFFSDDATRAEMVNSYMHNRYILDPHGAVGLLGWKEFKKTAPKNAQGIVLETAHPTKFIDVVKKTLGVEPEIPKALADLINLEKKSVLMSPNYDELKSFLMSR